MGNAFHSYHSSLANRLTAWYGLSAIVLIFGTAYFPYWSVRRALESESSSLLFDKLQTIRLIVQSEDLDFHKLRERVEKEWPAKKFEKVYVRVLNNKDQVVASTPRVDASVTSLFTSIGRSHSTGVKSSFDKVGIRAYRYLAANIGTQGSVFNVALVLDQTDQDRIITNYRNGLYIALSLALILILFIARRIAVRGMQPLQEIAKQAGHIRSSNLHERIDLKAVPIELAQLASTFNEMLTRLQESFLRLSQFTADIAHELRTPVSNLSGEIEVTLGKNRTEDHYRDVLGSCLEESERISRIIDSLLFLARSEDPNNNVKMETVDLKKELETVLEFYEASIVEAGINTRLEVPEPVQIKVERTLFQRAVGNLLSNSLKQTPSRGTIRVSARRGDAGVTLEVEDTGRGISSEHLPHVFDRFYRVDPSRSKDSGGTGLGLAIVKSIAALHGGSVRIESELGKGTKIRLLFPDASDVT